jgi:hypothetical protein
VISHTQTITVDDLYLIDSQTLLDGTVITYTRSLTDSQVITRTAMYTTGLGIIADTWGYTETHLIHVIGFDAAGNQAESEKVRIYTIHKPEEEEEEETPTPTAMLPMAGAGRNDLPTMSERFLSYLPPSAPYSTSLPAASSLRRHPAGYWTGFG